MKKQHLPEKICLVCEKPFSWRKKWEKNWNDVKYCSERCRRNKKTTGLVWFGNDLRTHDNEVLHTAIQNHEKVIAVLLFRFKTL